MSLGRDNISEAIRRILLEKWDPVRVSGNINLRGEYDAYIDDIVDILNGPAPMRDRLLNYFHLVETKKMGLKSNRARALTTAEALVRMISD